MGERGERSRVEDVINGEVVERKTSNWGGGGGVMQRLLLWILVI